jgi:hypothetical protein
MLMEISILVMISILNIMKSWLNIVIKIITVLLMPVKFTNVLSNVKMNGELNTAQNLKIFIVLNHMSVLNAQVLGIVKISIILLLMLWLN